MSDKMPSLTSCTEQRNVIICTVLYIEIAPSDTCIFITQNKFEEIYNSQFVLQLNMKFSDGNESICNLKPTGRQSVTIGK